jgi:predicted transposase/invertase (TIGR01784 family)
MSDEVFFEMFVKEPYENGHKDGKEEGKQENKIENAINLLKNGVSIEIITESLKLTQKDLQIIKAAK